MNGDSPMTTLTKKWTLVPSEAAIQLPPAALDHITSMYVDGGVGGALGAVEPRQEKLRWATDTHAGRGRGYQASDLIDPTGSFGDDSSVDFLNLRVEKSDQERRARAKVAGEVFTPPFVVNRMLNSVDSPLLAVDSFFNVENPDDNESWITCSSRIEFASDTVDGMPAWERYVLSPRIEVACGEAPFLASAYNATTGTHIPIRDSAGVLNRIGILDRKFRVLFENVQDPFEWLNYAYGIIQSTYAFELQGDSLVLARLNMLNCFFDYLQDFSRHGIDEDGAPVGSRMREVIESRAHHRGGLVGYHGSSYMEFLATDVLSSISQTTFQMDGLSGVVPFTCSESCAACSAKSASSKLAHNGLVPVVWQNGEPERFELN